MSELIEDDNVLNNKIRKNFITNIIFGQKLINGLSQDKKRDTNIDYFYTHINHFNQQISEDWGNKINYKKYIDLIPQNIYEKLSPESDVPVKNKTNYIEPYCKKPLKFIPAMDIFKKVGFHYKLVKLESTHYDLLALLYHNDKIIGYIACGKKSSNVYKNLYIVLSKKYDERFFEQTNKKLAIINDITEDVAFFEKDCYNMYLKSFRNIIYSIIIDIFRDYKSIKNIVLIGEEEGGNFLQLFAIDIFNNKSDYSMFPSDLSFYLFTYNTAMLSTETFYNDLIEYLNKGNNSMITCFDSQNLAFQSWDVDDSKRIKYNIINLK